MKPADLKKLIALGEGQHLEFKRGLGDDLGREIVSFANSLGGTILIGVEDNGEIVGVSGHNRLKGQVQSHARNCDPPVAVIVEPVDSVLVVTVPQSSDKPHSAGGRYYLREGATAQQMSRTQIRDFFFKEGLIYFDAMVNAQFDLKRDLQTKRYRQFATTASIPGSLDMTDTLRNLRLLTRGGMTNAGALLLGKQGSRYLVSSTVTCALFQGISKTKILDQKVFDDDIASNYHSTLLYLQSHLNTEYIITSERRSKLELPVEALREAVVNALAHRDYRSPADTQVYIFQDRVEIVNPGGLAGGLTLADLGKRSAPRNPLLFGILYRMGLVEHVGSGMTRIGDVLSEQGLPAPVFDVNEHWFSIVFPRAVAEGTTKKTTRKTTRKTTEKPATRNTKKTADRIIDTILASPSVTTREMAALIGLSQDGIIWHTRRLRASGRIRRIGPDKGGRWEVVGTT